MSPNARAARKWAQAKRGPEWLGSCVAKKSLREPLNSRVAAASRAGCSASRARARHARQRTIRVCEANVALDRKENEIALTRSAGP